MANAVDKKVGGLVRARRVALGMSQTKLAEAVDLTFQQIQKYEKGINRISASRLQQFSNILGVPVSFFFEGSPSSSSRSQTNAADQALNNLSKFISSSDGIDFMKAFMQIKNAKSRRGIVNFLEALVDRTED